MRTLIPISILLLVGPMTLRAQQQDSLGLVLRETRSRKVETLLLAGTAGMITGAFAGGLIGSKIDGGGGLDGADGAVVGGLVGITVLIPTSVHLANFERGDLGRSVLISALVGGAFLGLGIAAGSAEIVLAVPFIQLFTAMSVELDTAKRRAR
jgi:hypothetical protein